jgi:Zn-dependent protease with chaperone function
MLTIPFVLLALATFVSLASLICHIALPSILRTLEPVNPEIRSHLLLLVCAAPWLIGTSILVSSVADIFFGGCTFGTVCLWNEDPASIESLHTLVIAPLVLATAILSIRILHQHILSRRILATLDGTSVPGDDPSLRVIPSDLALAFAGNGQIYVSSALRDALPEESFRAVILHEQAHLLRRDGFFQTLAGILSASYLPPFRKRLLHALALANEQACDQHAASVVGATTVASAVLAVERMTGGTPALVRPGFADSFIPERIHRLVNQTPPKWNVRLIRNTVVLGIVLAFLTADILYYLGLMILYPTAWI